jgi:hypothetical protein
MKKTIWYKNWLGQWVQSPLSPTQKNLSVVRKTLALNGVVEIFEK